MNALWVDEGNDADYARARANGITTLCFALRDPRVTRSYLKQVRDEGFNVGVYAAWNWYPKLDGEGFARQVHVLLQKAAPDTSPSFPSVCLDIETHDVTYILDCLAEWRILRSQRVTDWTLEGFQGGLFSPLAVGQIHHARVGVVPANYTGSMKPQAADRVALDLVTAGFRPDVLKGFYDAAALPERWDGYAFTQGRLP